MRDINRIDAVLEEIKKIWKQYPDMRLCQLINNVVQDPIAYYLEDDELVRVLKDFYLKEQ